MNINPNNNINPISNQAFTNFNNLNMNNQNFNNLQTNPTNNYFGNISPNSINSNYINQNTLNNNLNPNDALFDIRKKVIGNDFINIVWLENPYLDFDPNIILSGAILMYIVIYPYSEKTYLIKFKFNKNSRIKIKEKLLNYFTDELLINSEFLSQFLINKIILINLMIKYFLDNTNYKRIEIDLHFNNIPDPNPNKIYYETNLSLRNQIIKNVINKNF